LPGYEFHSVIFIANAIFLVINFLVDGRNVLESLAKILLHKYDGSRCGYLHNGVLHKSVLSLVKLKTCRDGFKFEFVYFRMVGLFIHEYFTILCKFLLIKIDARNRMGHVTDLWSVYLNKSVPNHVRLTGRNHLEYNRFMYFY